MLLFSFNMIFLKMIIINSFNSKNFKTINSKAVLIQFEKENKMETLKQVIVLS